MAKISRAAGAGRWHWAACVQAVWLFIGALVCVPAVAAGQEGTAAPPAFANRSAPPVPLIHFFELTSDDQNRANRALTYISTRWTNAYAIMLIELLNFVPSPATERDMLALLETKTGRTFGIDLDQLFKWIWQTDPGTHPQYAKFKAILYATIDERFAHYFDNSPNTTIRLDEIRWGGVLRDGIPPLDHPEMLSAAQATYLDDDNIVFGIELNDDARAYPKRILAWHEMVRDQIGGEELNGVYCTLCGSMIFYRATINGVQHVLGTSGFLYRSNKLMYDHTTESLWSTLTGQPVVGPLVGKGLKLEPLFVVTTTWGEWRKRHPMTKVLSLNTGYRRDYSEGAAYRDYFATDRLMFTVPKLDERLLNKAEVLALRFTQAPNQQLAIAADFLKMHPVYQMSVGPVEFVVLTDRTGANRVYQTGGRKFVSWDGNQTAVDAERNRWLVTEAALAGPNGAVLQRLPAHRAFWFGWYSAYPGTRLIK